MNANHSRFGGSSAHRWMQCPYSARKENQTVDQGGPAAERGNRLHAAAEVLFNDGSVALPAEDLRLVAEYVTFLKSMLAHTMHVELKVRGSSIHEEAFGTADFVGWDSELLTVVDLKTGRCVVDAADNMQLAYYAICCEDTLGISPEMYKLIIWQNREVRVWMPTKEYIRKVRDEMRSAAARADSTEPVLGSWCDFCKVKNCPAKTAVADRMKGLVNW